MKKIRKPKGVNNIKTALTTDKRSSENRVVAIRRLVNLETQRSRLSKELQKCLQKQSELREQIEDIIFEVEQLQGELNKEVTVPEETGQIRSRLRMKSEQLPKSAETRKFIIEY